MSYTKFVFFGPIGKPLVAMVSDWMRHFWILIRNRWTKFNETLQAGSTQRLLSGFLGRSGNQDDFPSLWLAGTFSTSPLEPLNGFWWNCTQWPITILCFLKSKDLLFYLIYTRALIWEHKGKKMLGFLMIDKLILPLWPTRQQRSPCHIVLRCTICGHLVPLFLKFCISSSWAVLFLFSSYAMKTQ